MDGNKIDLKKEDSKIISIILENIKKASNYLGEEIR